MAKVMFLKIDGSSETVVITCFDEAREMIGGYVQVLFMKEKVMMVDEDAKIAGKHPNETATKILLDFGINDWVAGDVIICDRADFEKM